jgi:hypothetical protein
MHSVSQSPRRDRTAELTDERRRAITTRIRWIARHIQALRLYTIPEGQERQ